MKGKKRKKQRKISFKLFLNKTLSPDDTGRYPVYLRITYKRQNTKIPDVFINHGVFVLTEEEFENFESGNQDRDFGEHEHFLHSSVKLYEDIIRYEESIDEDYSISGLAERARFYRTDVSSDLESQIVYFFNMEKRVQFPKLELTKEEIFNIKTINDNWHKIKNLISTSLKRLIEAYLLSTLFNLYKYNLKQSDFWFGGSYYHFLLKGGLVEFKSFMVDYFGKKENIDEDYLHNTLLDTHKDFISKFGILLNSIAFDKENQEVYHDLISDHLKAILEKRRDF